MQQLILSESYTRYQRRNHAVGMNLWHLEWCTKYRYKMFTKKHIRTTCEIVIKEVCKRNSFEMLALNVQPDHVHIVVNLPRGMTDVKALQQLKGLTAYMLFRLIPNIRKRYPKGHLWSKGSFGTTVGFVELQDVITYVENQ